MKPFLALLLFSLCSTPVWARDSLRLSVQQLHQMLQTNHDIKIFDVRSAENFQAGHIPGALNFPAALSFANKAVDGRIAAPALVQDLLRERGVNTNSQVVIYDDGKLIHAARLFWLLEVYGLEQIKVLDGGYELWVTEGLPVSLSEPEPVKQSDYVATINHHRLASKFTTLLATLNHAQLIIDARSTSDYLGHTSATPRKGHIPSAISIPSEENFNLNGLIRTIKPIDQLRSLYQSIPLDRKVIVYCTIGLVSSANYLAMRELGIDVANYDASWKEWANDRSLPVER